MYSTTASLSSSVQLKARRRPGNFITVDDLDDGSSRRIPPTLDSQSEDEGFGAYTYVPDIYEQEELRRQEQRHRDFYAPLSQRASSITERPPERLRELTRAKRDASVAPQTSPTSTSTALGPSIPNKQPFRVPTLDELQNERAKLVEEIYRANNGKEFNVNSPAQVAKVLFGPQGGSTERTILEAKAAAGNKMADLVLQYRALSQNIKRTKRREDTVTKGTLVRSASTVAREKEEETSDPLILVDASSYIFRAYYSMPPVHRSDGMPTGAVLGFCNMLNKLALDSIINREQPRLVLVFDAKGKTFRHEKYPLYKANRPDAPIDLIPQFPLVRQAAEAYGICQIEAPTYEADDVIATLAIMAVSEGIDVNIFSGDKDLMQLVTERGVEPSIQIIDPTSMSRVAYDQVVEKWGIPPAQLGDVLALAGDSADNVPGVPSIGPKIAAQLLQEFGSLDNLLANVGDVKQNARRRKLEEFGDQARLSRDLVELVRDVPLDLMTFPEGMETVGDLRIQPMDEDKILQFYDAMGFQDIRRRFLNAVNKGSPDKKPPAKNRRPPATIPTPEDFSDVPF